MLVTASDGFVFLIKNSLVKIAQIITAVFFTGFSLTVYGATTHKTKPENKKIFHEAPLTQEIIGKAFVLDGDSLRVAGNDIRLVKIDAPEYSQECYFQRKKYPCGQVSRDFLVHLAGGKKVKCVYAEKDMYQRFLAECFVGEKSINEELVRNGMAIVYNFSHAEGDKKIEDLTKLEKIAKKEKLGVWRGAFQLPKDYRKKHKK